MQMLTTQGSLYACAVREEDRVVLVGTVQHRQGVVSLNSPLPARFKERLNGRRWCLDHVDCTLGLSYYVPA